MDQEDFDELQARAIEAMQNGDHPLAERLERQLIAAIEAARNDPDLDLRDLLAQSCYNLGTVLSEQGRSSEAMPLYRRALALLPSLIAEDPLPQRRNLRAQASFNLGNGFIDANDPAQALPLFEQASALWEPLAEEFPDEPTFRNDLARSLFNRAFAHQLQNQLAPAQRCFHQAIAVWENLLDGVEEIAAWRFDLGRACYSLGDVCRRAGRLDQATVQLRQAVQHFAILLRHAPQRDDVIGGLQQFHDTLCRTLADSDQPDAMPAAKAEFVELLVTIAFDLPPESERQPEIAGLVYTQADGLSRIPAQAERAEAAYRQSITLHERYLEADPEDEAAREVLTGVWYDLGMLLRAHLRSDESEQAFGQSQKHLERLLVNQPEITGWQARLAGVHNNLGILYNDTGRLEKAEAAYKLALRVREGIEKRYPDDQDNRTFIGGTLCNLGHVARRRGRRDEALAYYDRSLRVLSSINNAPTAAGLVPQFIRNAREGRQFTLVPPQPPRSALRYTATLASRLSGPPPLFITSLPASTPGLDLYQKGRFAEVVNSARSNTPAARHLRARALARLERLEEALTELTGLHTANPSDINVRLDRGDLLRCLGRADEALKEADLAVGLAPTQPAGWLLRGLVLGRFLDTSGGVMEPFDRHANTQAIEAFDRYLSVAGQDPLGWRFRGRALARSCHATQAAYRAVVDLLGKEDSPPQDMVELANYRRDEFWELFGSALESFETAARLDPNNVEVWQDLAGHYLELTPGFESSARTALERVVRLRPDLRTWAEEKLGEQL